MDSGNAAEYSCMKDYSSHYTCGLAENIIYWPGRDRHNAKSIADKMMDNRMNSPGHRQNIMYTSYDRIGVVVRKCNVYATQNFC